MNTTIGYEASLLPVKNCVAEQDDYVTSSDAVYKHVAYNKSLQTKKTFHSLVLLLKHTMQMISVG